MNVRQLYEVIDAMDASMITKLVIYKELANNLPGVTAEEVTNDVYEEWLHDDFDLIETSIYVAQHYCENPNVRSLVEAAKNA